VYPYRIVRIIEFNSNNYALCLCYSCVSVSKLPTLRREIAAPLTGSFQMTLRTGLVAFFTAATLVAAPASAQTYPERAVEFIVPWSPGGGSDTLMRLVANNVAPFLGADMPVINMPGVGGTVGLREASTCGRWLYHQPSP
jgi:hypothetical protein